MTITYPLTLPSSNFQRLSIRSNVAAGVVRNPFTMQSQVHQFTGQMWIAEVTLPLLERADAEAWSAFLLKLYGPYGTFMLGDPLAATPRGTAPGAPKVKGGSNQGSTLDTDGWTAGQTGILLKGDYIQIDVNLYKVLNDVDSNGSGEATLDVFPMLRQAYADNTAITTSSAKGIWRLLQNDLPVYNVGEEKTYGVSFTAVEAID